MFESLTERLGGVFEGLRKRGALREEDVKAAMREVRIALLEADVALPVVKDFITTATDRAIGQAVLKSVAPGQQVIKIVNDALGEMLGQAEDINLQAAPPVPVLMVGLQGSGKTTSSAKLALHLQGKRAKKVLMASLDIYRPAAQQQLKVLGDDNNIATLPVIMGEKPAAIAKRAMKTAAREGFDVVMLDTAGRLHIDEALMREVADIRDIVTPAETLLVSDAMTGQDAVNVAREFAEKIGITGIVLTRVDGDARGGAALSMRHVTGKPIKFMGTGEKIDQLEPFHPERIANRILGMGDVVSLVEKAAETIRQEDAEKMAKKLSKGQFDMNDLLAQLQQIQKMGDLSGLMGMIPGMSGLKNKMKDVDLDDKLLKHQEAIIQSMTFKERHNPALIKASRKKRIAAGAGLTVQEVNKLLKQYQQMAGMIKKMGKKKGLFGNMAQMKEMMAMAETPEGAEAAGKDGLALPAGGLPGLGGSLPGLGGGLPGLGGGLPPGFPGLGSGRGGSKRKPKKRRK